MRKLILIENIRNILAITAPTSLIAHQLPWKCHFMPVCLPQMRLGSITSEILDRSVTLEWHVHPQRPPLSLLVLEDHSKLTLMKRGSCSFRGGSCRFWSEFGWICVSLISSFDLKIQMRRRNVLLLRGGSLRISSFDPFFFAWWKTNMASQAIP